jgi:Uma2 family endonuclease
MAVRPQGTRLTAEQFFRETPSDGKRYELIDGELHELTPLSIRHQTIARDLFRLLAPEVTSTGVRCSRQG